LYNNPGA
jgi:translation initiation factor IF-3